MSQNHQPKKPLPSWCVKPESENGAKVMIKISGEKPLELAQSRRYWVLGRKDNTIPQKPHLDLNASKTGATASRLHAILLRDSSGAVYIRDEQSSLGTYMGPEQRKLEPFEAVKWPSGTKILFGATDKPECAWATITITPLLIPKAKAEKRPLEEEAPASQPEAEKERPLSAGAGCPGKEANNESEATRPPSSASRESKADPQPATNDQDAQRAAKQRRMSAPVSQPAAEAPPVMGPALPPNFAHRQRPEPQDQLIQKAQEAARQQQRMAAASGKVQGPALPPGSASRRVSSVPPASGSKKCDKCDGPHPTDSCPHFKKGREEHKDAWQHYGKPPKTMGTSGGKVIIRNGQPVRQPGDGSCLFHSLCYGLNGGRSGGHQAQQLRRDLAEFIARNPRKEIAGDTLEEWVRWDARSTVQNYTRRMAHSGWGGGIEMAACALLKKVNVYVYEHRRSGGYERISSFEPPGSPRKTIHVLYQGGVHYDALVV